MNLWDGPPYLTIMLRVTADVPAVNPVCFSAFLAIFRVLLILESEAAGSLVMMRNCCCMAITSGRSAAEASEAKIWISSTLEGHL